MPDYAVRLSRSFTDLRGFFDKCKKHDIKCVVYEHPQDEDVARTHIHALLRNVSQSTDTLKNWVKASLNVTEYNKTDWSFKLARTEYDKYVTYMSKGVYEPLINDIYSESAIELLRGAWKDKVEVAKDKNIKVEVQVENVVKKNKNELMGEVASDLISRGISAEPTDRQIMKSVITVLSNNRIITNMYKMCDYVDSYKAWYHQDSFLEIMENYYVKSRYRQ